MTAVADTPLAPQRGERAAPRALTLASDRAVVAALCALFVIVVALTWQRWGAPEIDAGAELTTADLVAHGALPYRDVRYFYGPLGLYELALAFKLFGTSFTVAYGFGMAQAAAILAAFYALARRWLTPVVAGLSTAVLLAIGFSGTAFNFVLPHTNSATIGILCTLLMLLALARDRVVWAGVAAGLVGLTRPEFAGVAAAAGLAFLVGTWRVAGRRAALSAAWRLALPGVAIPVVALGWFAAKAGADRLLTQNLWPVDFIRVAGFHMQAGWMPFSIASGAGLLLRAATYGGLLAGLVGSAVMWSRRRGAARLVAAAPLMAAVLALALGDLALRATGLFGGERAAVEQEARDLLLGMSWLPALGLGAAAWCALAFMRRRRSPLGGTWPADLALVAAAAVLGLRAYNAFTTEASYAPYYAAPLVLLLGLLHQRTAERWPAARTVVLGALGLVAAGLFAYSLHGLYADDTTAVHTPRGTFKTSAAAGPAIQAAVNRVDAITRPGHAILAAPADGGIYFMTGRRPALYEVMLLPGLLATRADEERAIAELRRAPASAAVIGARDFSAWGWPRFGVDYNATLGAALRAATIERTDVGTAAHPAGGTYPSRGFEILRLRRLGAAGASG
jgi:hypothetical protein